MTEIERKKTLSSVKALFDFAISHMKDSIEGEKEKKKIAEHWREYLSDPLKKTFDSHFSIKLTIPFDIDALTKEPAPKTITTTTPGATTTIEKIVKTKPQPIVWLGRGYMGDANEE